MAAGEAEHGVLCADHHPGYGQPIGGGVAYEAHVSPSGVGYDIGCGNKAARTDLTRQDLDALGGGGADEAPEVYKRLPRCSRRTATPSASSTRCGRSASRWPAAT